MAMELSDGSIIPSYLGARNPVKLQDQGTHTNLALRVGEVQDIVYPTDQRSVSKTVIEYVVDVSQSDVYNATITTRYFAVPVTNFFGGVADFTNYTLRKAQNNQSDANLRTLSNGSKVLILCPNGRTSQALIVGGVHDPDQPNDDEQNGHNYVFQFNGVNIEINDDGEWTLTYNGASDIKGDPRDGVDKKKTGGFIQLDKDGNFNAMAPTNITLKSEGVMTGDATDKTILGTTYRDAESQMNNTLAAGFGALGGTITAINAGLQAAAGALTAAFPPAGAGLQAASAACITMKGQLDQMQTAIQSFEAAAAQYLSTKNKSD